MFSPLLVLILNVPSSPPQDSPLNPKLTTYVTSRLAEWDQIPAERRQALDQIADYLRERGTEPARLTFICTHNSRRSHLAQLWAQTAAAWYGVASVETFSGGTEATAFNPRAVAAAKRTGFEVTEPPESENPQYVVRYAKNLPPLTMYSKVYSAEPNPQSDFCAVMVCSQADAHCPVVAGAAQRVAIPFDDPKLSDGTLQEAETYDERCRQIAREMLYLFSRVNP